MRKLVLSWSTRAVVIFFAVLLFYMVMPAISLGLTHLGGLTGEPLIGFTGLADSMLLISRGLADSLLVISTTYVAPATSNVGATILDNALGIVIAVGVCIGLLRAAGSEKDPKSRAYLMATISIVGIFVYIISSRLLALFV